MKTENMPINAFLIVLDTNLKFQSIALILNILETQPQRTRVFVIYVYEDEFDRIEYQTLIDSTYEQFGFGAQKQFVEIKFIDVEVANELTSSFTIPEGSHITSATFLRLYISEILPSDIDTLLYLDIDVMINSSLDDLFAMNFSTPICAELNVPRSLGNGEHLQGHNAQYFNSGVMLINMKKWRDLNLLNEFIIVGSQETYPFVDQDILNIVFRNNWTRIGREFNYLHLYGSGEDDPAYCEFPKIIHFAGSKPWNETPVTQYVSKYRKNFNKIRELHALLRDGK
jgi:lipopolysaccharide biosynthesis glycosyltransferase